jgi:uncharacterized membrane protein YesL
MRDIFSLNGSIMNILSKISDICIISILWLLCCLPIVTIGASTTAAYYTFVKVVKRQSGTLLLEFFKAFRDNFKDSFLIRLLYLVMEGILIINICLMFQSLETTDFSFALEMFFIYIALLLLLISAEIYTYPVLSRFIMGRVQLVKFSFLIMLRHFPTTLLLNMLLIVTAAIMVIFPVGIIFMPGICLYGYSYLMEKILRKYMTKEMKNIWDEMGEIAQEY